MENKDLYSNLFHISSVLTDIFPRGGARTLDWSLTHLLGSDRMVKSKLGKDVDRLRNIKRIHKILVFSDLNIGDALFAQASVSALRDFFPAAEIDFVIGAAAQSLVEGNPEVSRLLPEFHGAPFPTQSDFDTVKRISTSRKYDLIFTFSPFFQLKNHFPARDKVFNFTTLASMLIQGERLKSVRNHVVYQTHKFVHDLFSGTIDPLREDEFTGITVTLSDAAVSEAERFLASRHLLDSEGLILLNPDASTRFTRIPVEAQVDLLKRLMSLPHNILLGAGHTDRGIEHRILERLTARERWRITVVPSSLPIDAYAALIDFTDLYISGDAGPLHIAAAHRRSRSGMYEFRNRTAVFSVFGATPARIYGYDSRYPEFFPANQDAPSHIYISPTPCRNITCINKMAKTCKTVRCFELVDVDEIAADINEVVGRVEVPKGVPLLVGNRASL